jgi:hypothetical protein
MSVSGMRAIVSRRLAGLVVSFLLVVAGEDAAAQGVNLFSPPGPESTGQPELTALAQAFPDRITSLDLRDDDWAVDLEGQWFYWAHGRILPEQERGTWEEYAPYRFYRYSLSGLPPVPALSEEDATRLQKILHEVRMRPPHKSESFLERLFNAGSRTEIEKRLVTVDFLGFRVQVHERIAGALKEVAADCETARAADPSIASFFAGLAEMDGFNYRDVAGTLSRSYHGYGLAVDLIPKSYAGKAPYWRWVMDTEERWWATPYEKRWPVPDKVVAAFERHGFVWGGKWLFFDTMHFEYRPEILALARAATDGASR